MTLPVSPNSISLGQVNTELSYSSTALISLNDSAVRNLAGSGFLTAGTTISLGNLHGKSANVVGQAAYTSVGTYNWICPTGVTSVCVVVIGPANTSGAWLAWRNNIPVTPGQTYQVYVIGTESYFGLVPGANPSSKLSVGSPNYYGAYFSGLSSDPTLLLLHGYNGLADYSGFNNTLTTVGSITGTTASGSINSQVISFGQGNAIRFPEIILPREYTIEFRIMVTGSSSNGYSVVFSTLYGSPSWLNVQIPIIETNGLVRYYNNGSDWTGNTPVLNIWRHIAITRDSNYLVKIYINGVLDSSGYDYNSVRLSTLGGWNNGTNYNVVGVMEEIRVSNSVRYTSNFTPPTTAHSNPPAVSARINSGGGVGGSAGGGGGAAGYTGSGGNAGYYAQNGQAGQGGGGGGGGGGSFEDLYNGEYHSVTGPGGGGGGVGLLGQGTSGAGGTSRPYPEQAQYGGTAGQGGSGGGSGVSASYASNGGDGGYYGGGAGGGADYQGTALGSSWSITADGTPGIGAVRIIWGQGRAFPSTNTGNL